MMMLPPIIISLPFKLVFFVLVDGWALVTGSPRSRALPVANEIRVDDTPDPEYRIH